MHIVLVYQSLGGSKTGFGKIGFMDVVFLFPQSMFIYVNPCLVMSANACSFRCFQKRSENGWCRSKTDEHE